MSDFDDPKDPIEEEPARSTGDSEKRPLGFEQEPSPADMGRRLVLKFALMGTAAALLPKGVEAALQGDAEPGQPTSVVPGAGTGTAGAPVVRPYSRQLSFQNQPGTLSNDSGAQAQYSVSGQGDLYIDAQGNVILSNVQATGLYVSGVLNHGTISVTQPTPSIAGTYTGTHVQATTTVLYSDAGTPQQPAAMTVSGDVYQGGSNLWVDVDINGSSGSGVDWRIRVGWSKATC
jgi:hypothetical protein